MPRKIGNRGPTIVDVARAAGVSVSTASRVVRQHPDVREETRTRVNDVIRELRYRPSPVARALVTGQARLLALLVSDVTNPFYPELAKAVEQEAKESGYLVAICNTEDDPDETRRYVDALQQMGLDGVVHASVAKDEDEVTKLLGDRRRIVFTNRRPTGEDASYVVSDNRGAAVELTRHLLERGHRVIGFIRGPRFASNSNDRVDGFEAAMAEVDDTAPMIAEGDHTAASGAAAVRTWFDGELRPTAIIAVNDAVAVGAYEALTARGLRVPDDVALAGFDGVASSRLLGITTVEQEIATMGRRAVQVLLAGLTDNARGEPTRIALPTRLRVRSSTEHRLDPTAGPTRR